MILLRHGQSEFNAAFSATRVDPGIPDPRLTPLGRQQAALAAEALAGERLARIIVSPFTRALETAAIIAARLDLPVVVNPLVRERCAFHCDIGTPASRLAREWPELDFSHLDEQWWPTLAESEAETEARARAFRAEMAALPDWSDTLVVTHWGFILCMTGERLQNGEWRRVDPTSPGPAEVPWLQV
jgi:broad specificity phosphatase PhoE